MSTVYVVPCGVSVLDQLGKGRKQLSGGTPARNFTKAVEDGVWLNGVDLDAADAVTAAWRAKVVAKAEAASLAKATAKWLSAETHSLATRLTRPPGSGECVLLLASDTKTGMSAAFCIAQYLAGSGQVAYVSSPATDGDAFTPQVMQAPVTVIRIRGLKPVGTNFDVAAMGIGKALRAAWDTGGLVEVHLTGGYKATLLHTLTMTETLHSLRPGRVSAWNVFEDVPDSSSDQPVSPGTIRLRTYLPEYLRIMRGELLGARDGSTGGSPTLQGVGWIEDAAGSRKLTDFGYGYLAVLGGSANPLGDDGQ